MHAVSRLKRNARAAPFERAFAEQAQLEQRGNVTASGALIPIQYRADEAMYILPAADRVTVVFSTRFAEETDRIFGKVFLQEFVDARRQPSIQNAPQVLYSNREPPLEIRQVPGLTRTDDTGFVTFVLFPRHFQHPDVRATTISHIQLFRDYLHYHSTFCVGPWLTQSNAPRHTCTAACARASPSSSRCSTAPSRSMRTRSARRLAAARSAARKCV